MSTQPKTLKALLAETSRLRARFEQHSPNSARISIMIRDERRLQRMIAEQVLA